MLSEPSERARRSRSEAASRLAALLAEVERGEREAHGVDRRDGGSPVPGVELAPRRPTSRRHRLMFGTAVVVLVVAIPALAVAGFNELLTGRHGRVLNPITDPAAPGYEAIVDPTPTALLVQVGEDGQPVSVTALALGAGDAGGTVVFVPPDTVLQRPVFLLGTLSAVAEQSGVEAMGQAAENVLGTAFGEMIVVDDAQLGAAVGPAAPIEIDNPDDVESDGVTFPSGPISLEPDEVGPYLAARNDGESDVNRLNRHQLFWRAWIDAIAAGADPPGRPDARSGLGRFVRTIAAGTAELAILPVRQREGDGRDLEYRPDFDAVRGLVAEAVPFPTSPEPGARYLARVLNGVEGAPLPRQITGNLVANRAQIASVGNARDLGRDTTVIEYYDPAREADAETARAALGAGRVELRRGATDSVDLNIIVGRDVLRGASVAEPAQPPGGAGD